MDDERGQGWSCFMESADRPDDCMIAKRLLFGGCVRDRWKSAQLMRLLSRHYLTDLQMSRGPQINNPADTEIDRLPSLFLPVPGLRLNTNENEGLDRGRPSFTV